MESEKRDLCTTLGAAKLCECVYLCPHLRLCRVVVSTPGCESTDLDLNFVVDSNSSSSSSSLYYWSINGYHGKVKCGNVNVTVALCP